MEPRPQYIVFAGVNGAGKSTLYRSGLWQRDEADSVFARVNPDEILKKSGADPFSLKAQIAAGKKQSSKPRSILRNENRSTRKPP